ncbi:MerR family transcriptional regulator [Lactobacillus sp. CBA3606]|uniref:MerR family transcriptional regulator n=1 Tax=Lactobacillus sp. CBA3606 TaxID=2099789 RepID=UPI000CFD9AFA|nr:MerR family transcriptional regulator [Lactobacillus sp. CBA3606]AVK62896.1 MerR family transcriptional regulator [Lactobacillus sp. CBA3606]
MKIKAVVEKYQISADTLRYWERVGAIPAVHRDQAGYRNYDQEDLGWIEFAQCMREAGVSIDYLIEYIDLFRRGEATRSARQALLNEQLVGIHQRLARMQKTYDLIKYKADHYEEHVEGYHGKLLPPK